MTYALSFIIRSVVSLIMLVITVKYFRKAKSSVNKGLFTKRQIILANLIGFLNAMFSLV